MKRCLLAAASLCALSILSACGGTKGGGGLADLRSLTHFAGRPRRGFDNFVLYYYR